MHLLGATLRDHLSHGQQMEAGRAGRVEWELGRCLWLESGTSSWLGAGAKALSQRWDLLSAALQVWVLAPEVGNIYSPGLSWCVFPPFLLLG